MKMDKNEILTRLIKEGHITFDEAKLLDGGDAMTPIPYPIIHIDPNYVPNQRPFYTHEWRPDLAPFYNTSDNNDSIDHMRHKITCEVN